jgi:hypothetical protein
MSRQPRGEARLGARTAEEAPSVLSVLVAPPCPCCGALVEFGEAHEPRCPRGPDPEVADAPRVAARRRTEATPDARGRR